MNAERASFDAKSFVKTVPGKPGVYRMLDQGGTVLYVGKARHLKKRIASYFGAHGKTNAKTHALVDQVQSIEMTVTHTEKEALILENNLIKELQPRYNIVLRDDKSYPYIHLSDQGGFPRLSFYRGSRRQPGRYFGPYPSAGAVRQTLNLLQKLFRVRNCEDSFFRNRSRPCLQYQIQRCTAPCVGLIDKASYNEDVGHAILFLEGRSQEVIENLVKRMEGASESLDFEQAARYRDQISSLSRVQEHQYISTKGGDLDIVACAARDGVGCVQIFYIRGGHNLGNKAFFPQHTVGADPTDVLSAFLPQYYLTNKTDRTIPVEILVSHPLKGALLLSEVLRSQDNEPVTVKHRIRGERARWMQMALENAEIALAQRLSSQASQYQRMEALREILGLDEPIERIECFDISHTQGEAAVAACIVMGPEGFTKSDYRRFNISNVEAGDDYAAMYQAINRRYTRVQKEEGRLPDLLLIDGGKGQVTQAKAVLHELQITDICVLGIAKGPSRKPGLETLILSTEKRPIRLPADSPALHLIQRVRDEAHRFAITGHRQRRAHTRTTSLLETIAGIGRKRRRQLISHFGGLQGVSRAGVEDLIKVPGINRHLAQKIYDTFHEMP
ncbi:MAG: excinuclease ABC subunit UvrC [Gammaproteobacteria bacterium]|nr:excinuclease ABC subunit UvrC [Gammaproteobacteria bacterium]